MNPPTPPSATANERRGSAQELVLAVLVVVLMSRFLSAFAFYGQGAMTDEPVHKIVDGRRGVVTVPYDLLGHGDKQEIRCQSSGGSHWNSLSLDVVDHARTIFSASLMGHSDPGRIWFSTGPKPLHIFVWQPWNDEEGDHPIGYWRYDFDGTTYMRRPLPTQPLLLWLENPIGGLDL